MSHTFKTPILERIDRFAINPVSRLHFDNNEMHSSKCGGICSICVYILCPFIFWTLAQPYINKTKGVHNVSREIAPQNLENFYKDSPQIILEITDGVKDHEIDPSKVDIFIEHTFFNKSVQNAPINTTRYEMGLCTVDDFDGDHHEALVWKTAIASGKKWNCILDPQNTLSLFQNEHQSVFSTMEIKIARCSGIQCSSKAEIDTWLKSKNFKFGFIDNEVQEQNLEHPIIRQWKPLRNIAYNPISWTQSIVNFKWNKFRLKDNIWHEMMPWSRGAKIFPFVSFEDIDYNVFSKDGYDFANENYTEYENLIGKVVINNSESILKYQRRLGTFLQYFSEVAGIPTFLTGLIVYMIGSFQKFNSDLEMTNSCFNEKSCPDEDGEDGDGHHGEETEREGGDIEKETNALNKIDSDDSDDENKIRAHFCTRLKDYIFMRTYGLKKYCCCNLWQSEEVQRDLDRKTQFENIFRKQFNLKAIIIKLTLLQYFQRKIFKKIEMKCEDVSVLDIWQKTNPIKEKDAEKHIEMSEIKDDFHSDCFTKNM